LFGMLMTSAVAIFFSCSAATGLSGIGFDLGGPDVPVVLVPEWTFVAPNPVWLVRWTDQAREGYVLSSFFGAELSTFTPVPERIVRKIL